VGEMFRVHAQRNNKTVAELSRELRLQLLNPLSTKRVDVEMDFATCEVISGYGINGYGVVEGRQPAVMGMSLYFLHCMLMDCYVMFRNFHER
jgi:hypothetical protein